MPYVSTLQHWRSPVACRSECCSLADFSFVLAHQGGWDEILLVAGPILLFVLLLRLANKRAEEKLRERNAALTDPNHDSAP